MPEGDKKEGGIKDMWNSRETFQKIKQFVMSRMGLLLLAGVLLVLFSRQMMGNGGIVELSQEEAVSQAGFAETEDETFLYLERQEERLREVLSQIDGVGKVEVMLYAAATGERIVQSDNPYTQKQTDETDSAGGTRKTTEVSREDATVYVSEGSRQEPFVIKETEPELEGVLILAEGAGSDTVKAEITEAVEALFGLPAHRIKVIKRRG